MEAEIIKMKDAVSKDKISEVIISLLKENKNVSFITLSKNLNMNFAEIKDLLAKINRNNLIRIIYPAIGCPYITIE